MSEKVGKEPEIKQFKRDIGEPLGALDDLQAAMQANTEADLGTASGVDEFTAEKDSGYEDRIKPPVRKKKTASPKLTSTVSEEEHRLLGNAMDSITSETRENSLTLFGELSEDAQKFLQDERVSKDEDSFPAGSFITKEIVNSLRNSDFAEEVAGYTEEEADTVDEAANVVAGGVSEVPVSELPNIVKMETGDLSEKALGVIEGYRIIEPDDIDGKDEKFLTPKEVNILLHSKYSPEIFAHEDKRRQENEPVVVENLEVLEPATEITINSLSEGAQGIIEGFRIIEPHDAVNQVDGFITLRERKLLESSKYSKELLPKKEEEVNEVIDVVGTVVEDEEKKKISEAVVDNPVTPENKPEEQEEMVANNPVEITKKIPEEVEVVEVIDEVVEAQVKDETPDSEAIKSDFITPENKPEEHEEVAANNPVEITKIKLEEEVEEVEAVDKVAEVPIEKEAPATTQEIAEEKLETQEGAIDEIEVEKSENDALEVFTESLHQYNLDESDLAAIESQNALGAKQHMLEVLLRFKSKDEAKEEIFSEDSQEDAQAESLEEEVTVVEKVEEYQNPHMPIEGGAFNTMLPKEERDESGRDVFENSIAEAGSFEDIINVINTVDYIEGSLGFYTSKQLSDIITMVAEGKQSPLIVTKNVGIRKKVLELLNRAPEINIENPESIEAVGEKKEKKSKKRNKIENNEVDDEDVNSELLELDEKFRAVKERFLEQEETYYATMEEEHKQVQETGFMGRLKSAFGGRQPYETATVDHEISKREYQSTMGEYAKALLEYDYALQKENSKGKICFSDLDSVSKKYLQQLALDGVIKQEGFKDDSVVKKDAIKILLKENILSEEQVKNYKINYDHPTLRANAELKIWNGLYISDRDKVENMISKKDYGIFKRMMMRNRNNGSVATGLLSEEIMSQIQS